MRPRSGSVEGIASAQRTGNAHALGEMQALLEEMEIPE